MKRMKTLLSVLLVVMLALSLTVPAFAAGSIKILNPKDTKSYKVYKVFDVADDGYGELVYTLNNQDLKDTLDANPFPGLTITGTATPYTVTKGSGFSSANFAEYLQTHLSDLGTEVATIDGTETPVAWKAAIAEDGYYLIVPSGSDQTAALTTVFGNDVAVQDKTDIPFEKVIKDADPEDEDIVKVGDTVTYQIKGQVPELATDVTFLSYIIRDTMDAGLTFDPNSVKVTIGSTVIYDNSDTDPDKHVPVYTGTDPLTGDQIRYGGDYTFELSLELFNRIKNSTITPGQPIVIEYSAVVNDNAYNKISENQATLEYRDDNGIYTKDDSTKVYPVTIVVDKFETGANEQKLSGAKFVLYKVVNEGGTDVKYYYKETSGVVTWVKSSDLTPTADDPSTATNITTVTTDAEGAAHFDYVPDGDYFLLETEAPEGYVKYDEPIPVTVNADAAVHPATTLTDDQIAQLLTTYVHVANTPGSVLPSTGGRGATMLYIAGLALILVSGAYLVLRKRCEA